MIDIIRRQLGVIELNVFITTTTTFLVVFIIHTTNNVLYVHVSLFAQPASGQTTDYCKTVPPPRFTLGYLVKTRCYTYYVE